jgi:hypothetical protein
MRDRYVLGVRWTETFHPFRKEDNAIAFPDQTAAGGCMVRHQVGVKRTPLPRWKIACAWVLFSLWTLKHRGVAFRFAAAQHAGS